MATNGKRWEAINDSALEETSDDDFDTGVEIISAISREASPARARMLAIVSAAQRAYFRDGVTTAALLLARKADEYDYSDSERLELRNEFMAAIR